VHHDGGFHRAEAIGIACGFGLLFSCDFNDKSKSPLPPFFKGGIAAGALTQLASWNIALLEYNGNIYNGNIVLPGYKMRLASGSSPPLKKGATGDLLFGESRKTAKRASKVSALATDKHRQRQSPAWRGCIRNNFPLSSSTST
jgi:hypothetical protein